MPVFCLTDAGFTFRNGGMPVSGNGDFSVFVIDSGIDGGHPEFPRSRIWQARSWVGGSPLSDDALVASS